VATERRRKCRTRRVWSNIWLTSLPATIGVCLLVLAVGCETPPGATRLGEIDAASVPTRDDITQIIQYWRRDPWLFDEDRRPVGFQATVYFVSGATARGAFVPGKILVWMYELQPKPEGGFERKLVYGWEFDERESVLYRVRRKSIQGYYYGFPLRWGPEVDVLGKPIEVVFGYQRRDGRILTAPGHRERVPVPPGFSRRPLTTRPTSPAQAESSDNRQDAP